MSADRRGDLQLEIGHVLAMDVVGYSKLLIHEQSELLQRLNEIVRGTNQFREANAQGKLIRLPTGDGIVLVFSNDPKAPIECAREIAAALKNHPEVQLRMGIHSGPVNQVLDVNERTNVAGAGIDIAQRVMDCGDARHILVSKRVADDLAPYSRWNTHLHELGECEVKHGRKISLVNFYTDEVGNPQAPQKCQEQKNKIAGPIAADKTKSDPSRKGLFIGAAVLIILVSLVGLSFFLRQGVPRHETNTAPPKAPTNSKSIAVLPFENLSRDPENAYFADGIQEEILTRLSKIADLKVISRTSTQRYKSSPDNLLEIAKQLGVAHILEGSVQRSTEQVRVTVQLINATNDSHIWAETYDRKLIDVFQVESDVAEKIASALEAKLTGLEKHEIAAVGTRNSQAYDAYLRALTIYHEDNYDARTRSLQALEEAVRIDPDFAAAWALLARMETLTYSYSDKTSGRAIAARTALETALRLQPDLPETQIAKGLYEERVLADYDSARRTFETLHSRWPNNADVAEALGRYRFGARRSKEWTQLFRRSDRPQPARSGFAQRGRLRANGRSRFRRCASSARPSPRDLAG